jgi:DNA (cytosine-5)-methyltransferase 1
MTARSKKRFRPSKVKVVDLFCGVGGLTYGMQRAGLNVVAGIDNDKTCKFAFEANNDAKFLHRDIARVTPEQISELFDGATVKVLVGCAPCQPYSSLNRRKLTKKQKLKRWYPMYRFMRIVKEVKPEVVSMENVPDLANGDKYPVFAEFVETLRQLNYSVTFSVIDASRYGVPQKRRRLVMLASRLGNIQLISPTRSKNDPMTVRKAIKKLPRIKHGVANSKDFLHRSSKLSEKNLKRIAATPKDGGSASSWTKDLIPTCYTKKSGKSYMSTVYGRMRWDDPGPTITTQCTTLGTGRFGHPTQNRAISLREAAVLQTFPMAYKFATKEDFSMRNTARHIGNAVPVKLVEAIGKSIKQHIQEAA